MQYQNAVSGSFHTKENLLNNSKGISSWQTNFSPYDSNNKSNFNPLCKISNIHTDFNPFYELSNKYKFQSTSKEN